jgi:hypothetical protein
MLKELIKEDIKLQKLVKLISKMEHISLTSLHDKLGYDDGFNIDLIKHFLELTEKYDGSIDFENIQIKSLGKLKYVGGDLDLFLTNLKSLGNLEYVGGYLNIQGTKIKSLGKLNHVEAKIYVDEDFPIDSNVIEKQTGCWAAVYGE